MAEERFLKFVSGRFWLIPTRTSEHPYKVFKDRHEAKVWLIDHGMPRTAAEDRLVEVEAGPRVVLPVPF